MRAWCTPSSRLHVVPAGFPDIPERLDWAVEAARQAGADLRTPSVEQLEAEECAALVDRVHIDRRLERLAKAAEPLRARLDTPDCPVSTGTPTAALVALQTTLVAWRHAAETGGAGLALVRPPGHHATPRLAMGFCYLNNVAIAARLAQDLGRRRVAILDFDVHHGNGTQELFYHRRDVLYTSIHEHGLFPGTGSYDEVGVEEGAGYTINVPLVRGAGDAHYARVMQELLAPALREFQPDLILVSAGYDPHHAEPLAEMDCSARAFYDWTALLARTADETCAGRLVLVLEGGYSLTWLGPCVENSLRALLGRGPSDIADRSAEPHPGQREMIENALELVLKTHRERLGL